MLGRARRRTLAIDAGGHSNRSAEGVGGLLGHDGRPPADLYAGGRAGDHCEHGRRDDYHESEAGRELSASAVPELGPHVDGDGPDPRMNGR